MGKSRVKISTKPGRSGTKIAGGTIKVKHGNGRGKPMFQTKAQLTLRVETTQDGQQRQKSRS